MREERERDLSRAGHEYACAWRAYQTAHAAWYDAASPAERAVPAPDAAYRPALDAASAAWDALRRAALALGDAP